MNNNKPTNTLTWKKDHKYAKIDKIHHETIYINKATGNQISVQEATQIPPITRKRKHK